MAKANPKTASIEDLKQDGAQGEDAPKQPNKGKVKSDEPLLPTSMKILVSIATGMLAWKSLTPKKSSY